ncbi:TIGR02147 family protein [Bdellovibrio bacteriovorus]|uniref:TIGR02147 family protein n=1 Tax=Bdellovibrio bacteriovorus TaxID=959 RepID=UPI003AA9B026
MELLKFLNTRDVLLADYQIRRKKNPRFSLRSYAKLLGISSGRLSDILNGRSPLTEKKALALVERLSLEPFEKQHFLRLAENEALQRSEGRTVRGRKKSAAYRLRMDQLALIEEWEHFALMSLIETSTFRFDKKWIARKLGLTQARLEEVLEKLLSLSFVAIDSTGQLKNVHRAMSTLTDIPSAALKNANTSCIMQALEKMHSVDVLDRDITSMTFPVDPQQIKEAKKLIREFKGKMAKLMKKGSTSEIYNLNIQLVPVSELGV